MPAALFKLTEGIEEASLDERGETSAFLGREAVIFQVGFGMGEVDLGVSHVEVAAENYRFATFQLLEVTAEIAAELGARVIKQFPAQGYGPAMDTALRSGLGRVVVTLDAGASSRAGSI